jgi:hypothetical protein
MASDDLATLSSVASILLGILTYFLTLVNESTCHLLAEEVPPKEQGRACQALPSRLGQTLLRAHLPVSVGLILLFYLCLPATTHILRISSMDLWHFDPIPSMFVFLQLGLLGCLIFALSRAYVVLKRLRSVPHA